MIEYINLSHRLVIQQRLLLFLEVDCIPFYLFKELRLLWGPPGS